MRPDASARSHFVSSQRTRPACLGSHRTTNDVQVDQLDPYRAFNSEALIAAHGMVEPVPASEPEYSNFGFQLLGHLLGVGGGDTYENLVLNRVLHPAGCVNARCGDTGGEPDCRVPGYSGASEVPHWTQPLAGAGGIELDVVDLGRWIEANTWPDRAPLEEAMVLAQEPHWGDRKAGRGLGWRFYNGGVLHNGETGGFRSVCVFLPGVGGVGVMANIGGWDAMDGAAIRLLTRIARAG